MKSIPPALALGEPVVYAKDQPQYLPLPTEVITKTLDGGNHVIVTRWRLTWRERLRLLLGADFFCEMLLFGHPLTPLRLSIASRDQARRDLQIAYAVRDDLDATLINPPTGEKY